MPAAVPSRSSLISRNPESVEALFAAADEAFGQVDILVNVPFAFPERSRPHELSLAAWEKTLAVSLNGYFYCAQQAIRRMLEQGNGGAILNIGSIASVSALGRGNFPYSVAKGGITQLTRELAVEYARDGNTGQRDSSGPGHDAWFQERAAGRPHDLVKSCASASSPAFPSAEYSILKTL